jgi:predicted transposase/invertase (TIGR01784 family)
MKAGALEEGIKEGKTDVAKRMLEKGLKIEQIVNFTGLTKEEIEELAENYGFEGNS